MQFNYTVCIITMALVVIAGFFAWLNDDLFGNPPLTGDPPHSDIGFLNHGGMWGDFLLLSFVNGLLWSHLHLTAVLILPSLCVAFWLTLVAHKQWMRLYCRDEISGHMFKSPNFVPRLSEKHFDVAWKQNLTEAGWLRVVYMALQIAILIVYVFSSIPQSVVWTTSLLLTAHVILGTVQPGWYVSRKLWTKQNMVPPAICASLIWLIG